MDDNTEVLSVETDVNELISVSNSNIDVLSLNIQQNEILSYSSSGYYDYDSKGNYYEATIEYTTFNIVQLKVPKKYKKYLFDDRKPSKKNKKAWKKYKAYKKYEKRLKKKAIKMAKKVRTKAERGHWEFYGDLMYKLKYTKKYVYIKFSVNAERVYRYYPSTDKFKWVT